MKMEEEELGGRRGRSRLEMIKIHYTELGVVAHTFHPSTQDADGAWST